MTTRIVMLRLLPILTLAALVVPATAAPSTALAARCHPKGSKAVARNGDVRVYRATPGTVRRVYACHLATGRTTLLGDDEETFADFNAIQQVRLAGRYVAFAKERGGTEGLQAEGRVLDARTGRIIRETSRGRLVNPDVGETPTERAVIRDAVVTRRGTAAFVFQLVGTPDRFEIHRLDGRTRRSRTIVDEGPDIEPETLRLSDSRTLSWRRAGFGQSAPIR